MLFSREAKKKHIFLDQEYPQFRVLAAFFSAPGKIHGSGMYYRPGKETGEKVVGLGGVTGLVTPSPGTIPSPWYDVGRYVHSDPSCLAPV